MRLKVEVLRGEDKTVYEIGPRAQVGWEFKTGNRITDLGEGIGVRDLCIMVMEQMKADGVPISEVPKTVELFAESIDDINPVEDEDKQETDPSAPGA